MEALLVGLALAERVSDPIRNRLRNLNPPHDVFEKARKLLLASREGYFAASTNDVERLSGRPARTLREVVEAGLHPAVA